MIAIVLALALLFGTVACDAAQPTPANNEQEITEQEIYVTPEVKDDKPVSIDASVYSLPSPQTDGGISVEKALQDRRSRREYQDKAISADQLSQILWAAYGFTSPGRRTTPSAGALYFLEIYVAVGNVEGIAPGVYKYVSEEHIITRIVEGDVRNELGEAAQQSVVEAPATVFYCADFEKAIESYGEDDLKYVYMEAGHSSQNVYLQAESLGLGTCAIAGFVGGYLREVFRLPENEEPLYLIPIGFIKE